MSADKTTVTNANKALVLAGIKGVFIDRDPTVLDRMFSDDYQQHNPKRSAASWRSSSATHH
jgi:predicted SnoaL-like aldol condensation-catalyzing enzyme